MNETIRTLLNRRSIRKYKPEPVPEELLEQILQVGIWTMSGMNMQSVKLVLIQSDAMREKLFAAAEAFPNRGGNPFYGAPAVVIAFADRDACTPLQDASLALGNMANAAYSLGIGSCWINCVRDLFETEAGKGLRAGLLPDENYLPAGSLALGYPDETPEPKPRNEGRILRY